MTTRFRRAAALLGSGALALSLTACAASGGQTTQEACTLVEDAITAATEEFGSAASDPAAVIDAVDAASEKLSGLTAQVTNDEVAAVLPDLQRMFAEVGETMTAIVEGDVDRLGDLQALGASFRTTTERVQEICAG